MSKPREISKANTDHLGLYEILKNERKYEGMGCLPSITPVRRNFGPLQVRCRHELKRGLTYRRVHSRPPNEFSQSFVVVRDPYNQESWWINVRYCDSLSGYAIPMSLMDQNVEPYHMNLWNAWNYVVFTDTSRHLKGCCLCHKGR